MSAARPESVGFLVLHLVSSSKLDAKDVARMSTCPKCGSTQVRKSRRHGFGDMLKRLRGQRAKRCRICRHRFFESASVGTSRASRRRGGHLIRFFRISSKTRKKVFRIGVLGIFVVLALYILVTFLFRSYSTSESGPSEGTSSIVLPAGTQLPL